MADIAIRASATQAFSSGATSRVFTVPASVEDGDISWVVLYVENNTVQTITTPGTETWTEIAPEPNTTTNPDFHVHQFWARLAASSAGTTRTFSWSTSSGCSIGMVLIDNGIASGDPQDATVTFTTNAAGNVNLVAPDITPATQPHMEMTAAASFAGPSSWTVPSGMAYTNAWTSDTTALAYLRRTSTSAPGVRTHVVNASGRWIANHILIKEETGSALSSFPPMSPMRPYLHLIGR